MFAMKFINSLKEKDLHESFKTFGFSEELR